IAAARTPWRPRRATTREHDFPACLVQLLGDLTTRLSAPDHKHLPRRQCAFVLVVIGVELGLTTWRYDGRPISGTRWRDRRVRGHQTEAVPTISPALPHQATLQHHMFNTGRHQLVTDRQTGLPRPNDDDVHRQRAR